MDIILGREGHTKGLWGSYSCATVQTFIQSKKVSARGGCTNVAQNKQIQGYMVPKQHKNSHVCVCGFSLMWNSETFYWLDLHRTACVACTILLTEAVKKGGRGKKLGAGEEVRQKPRKVKFPAFWCWRHLWATLWTCALKTGEASLSPVVPSGRPARSPTYRFSSFIHPPILTSPYHQWMSTNHCKLVYSPC